MSSLNDLVLLGILHRSGKPLHVYAIRAIVERHRIAQWARISKTGLYGRIKALEAHGWVTSAKKKAGNMPERVEYDLTDKGRTHLATMVDACIRRGGFYNADMNAALAFADVLTREQLLDCLYDRLARSRAGALLLQHDIEAEPDTEFNFDLFFDQLGVIVNSQVSRTEGLIAAIEKGDIALGPNDKKRRAKRKPRTSKKE